MNFISNNEKNYCFSIRKIKKIERAMLFYAVSLTVEGKWFVLSRLHRKCDVQLEMDEGEASASLKTDSASFPFAMAAVASLASRCSRSSGRNFQGQRIFPSNHLISSTARR